MTTKNAPTAPPPVPPGGARTIVYEPGDEQRLCCKCGVAFTWLYCVTKPQGDWDKSWCGCPPLGPNVRPLTTLF